MTRRGSCRKSTLRVSDLLVRQRQMARSGSSRHLGRFAACSGQHVPGSVVWSVRCGDVREYACGRDPRKRGLACVARPPCIEQRPENRVRIREVQPQPARSIGVTIARPARTRRCWRWNGRVGNSVLLASTTDFIQRRCFFIFSTPQSCPSWSGRLYASAEDKDGVGLGP